MEYAINILKIEIEHLERCLSNWDLNQYPDVRKKRLNRLTDLNRAIQLLSIDNIYEVTNCGIDGIKKSCKYCKSVIK